MRSALRLLPALLVALSLAAADPPRSGLRSGPMLGYSEITETVVWLQTRDSAPVQIRYWKKGEPARARLSAPLVTTAEGDHIAKFVLGGLEFGTEYEYEVYLDGARLDLPFETRFRTQPMWRWRVAPPSFRVALGSCAFINDPPFDRPGEPYGGGMEIFTAIAAVRPDLMVWLGDNIYYREADWETESGMRNRWAQNRELPELAPLLAATHHYATWDDHDYGPNNSDRTYPMREVSLEVFRDYWGNRTSGTPETPGVFQKFTWVDVDFFLMDDRYYRSPNALPLSPGKMMWGEAQVQWLEESLAFSDAPFKIVVNGSQVLNRLGREESLPNFAEYPRLLEFIREQRIGGVLFVTGDRHHTILMSQQQADGYPLYDLTTSPLTAKVSPAREGVEHELAVPGTYFPQRNFATLEFTGPRTDRSMTIRIHDAKGGIAWTRTIAAKELRFP